MAAIHQWALQDAKAQFSEVVKKAENEGPQMISVRGRPAVVMISQKEYAALVVPEESLVDFLRKSPLMGLDIEFERDKSSPRDIKKISAAEFKTKCLQLMDYVNQTHEVIVITKHNKPVARLTSVSNEPVEAFGCMKNTVTINTNIIDPIDVVWNANE